MNFHIRGNTPKVKMRYITFALFISSLISGCATNYNPITSPDSAKLSITGNTKYFFVDAFEDESCAANKFGDRVATFWGPRSNVDNHSIGVTINLPVEKKIFLNFHYIDAQPGLNRICDMSVGFSPDTKGDYRAHFVTDTSVSGCDVRLTQLKDGKVLNVPTFYVLPHTCLGGKNVGAMNGGAQRLHWKVDVMFLPSR